MKAFRVQGTFPMGLKTSTFAIETAEKDANAAKERVLSTIGSRHSVQRRFITITDVKEIAASDVSDPAVAHALELAQSK